MDPRQRALDYHRLPTPGKLTVQPTKTCRTAEDLALAYAPGVAEPCRRIAADPAESYRYTNRANLVAVVTNGSRVVGLGDIGPAAAKPVMEGKAILFKRFAGVDVFDLELDTRDVDEFCLVVERIAPGFGGVNLEDVSSPAGEEIARRLRASLDIPVFHDAQHGPAVLAGAAMINGLRVQEKPLDEAAVVIYGGGAIAASVEKVLRGCGLTDPQLTRCETRDEFTAGVRGADLVISTTGPGSVAAADLEAMAPRPVFVSLRGEGPAVSEADARAARPDLVFASREKGGVNECDTLMVFPGLFRGALDVGATRLDIALKCAAAKALAGLAREPVPEEVRRTYGGARFEFGPGYILPRALDPRVLTWVAPAVARAAIEAGVARREVDDWFDYRRQLERRYGLRLPILKQIKQVARRDPQAIVFPEGDSPLVLAAVERILEQGFARPILLGDEAVIRDRLAARGVTGDVRVVDPVTDPRRAEYADELFALRRRRGGSRMGAREAVKMNNTFACLMVRRGHADAMISGAEHSFAETVLPAFRIIGRKPGVERVSGIHMVACEGRMYFFADTSVTIRPTAEQLADIAVGAARLAEAFRMRPRVAMLSYSSFGSVAHPDVDKVRRATELVRARDPELSVEGEIAPDVALSPEVVGEHYPQSLIKGDANILVFPDLSSGNLAYKTVEQMADAEVVGPLLIGFSKPVCILPQGTTVENVVNMAAMMAVAAIDPGSLGGAPEARDLSAARPG